jgi:hypothetical protein|tara:strand:+ start:561 stop:749 length:189 start_codon:yes stop_codon:yes gene_type:complete
MGKKIDLITAFEIALDMLDRVDGTALYNIQKDYYKYSDKEYQQMLKLLTGIYKYLLEQDENK